MGEGAAGSSIPSGWTVVTWLMEKYHKAELDAARSENRDKDPGDSTAERYRFNNDLYRMILAGLGGPAVRDRGTATADDGLVIGTAAAGRAVISGDIKTIIVDHLHNPPCNLRQLHVIYMSV